VTYTLETDRKRNITGIPILANCPKVIVFPPDKPNWYLELKFSTRLAATGPAVAPKMVAEDPARTPSERDHHITWWGNARVNPSTMGKNRAVVGPAFKKAVKRAAHHIKIRHRSHGLPKERTVSPLEIYCNSPEASSPPTTTNSPIKKRISLNPTLLKTFLRSIPENRKSDNPPKRATAEGFKKVFSEMINSNMT
jgi:hypothetical protein